MNQAQIEACRSSFNESELRIPINDETEANRILTQDANQTYADRLFHLIVTRDDTKITVASLRRLEKQFAMDAVLNEKSDDIAQVLSNICACTPGIMNADGSKALSGPANEIDTTQHVPASIKPFDDVGWAEAMDIGRALAKIKQYPTSNAQNTAITEAARRVRAQGFSFDVRQGIFEFSRAEMEKITASIAGGFRQLGLVGAVGNTINQALRNHKYDFDQILFGRSYAGGLGNRNPQYPIGFLFNLALQSPLEPPIRTINHQSVWRNTIDLARDFISMLDLEPYSQFSFIGTDALGLEGMLRRVAHYDHCFTLRQWQCSLTPRFINLFFGDKFDSDLNARLGWDITDATRLAFALAQQAGPQSKIILCDSLTIGSGLSRMKVHVMLPSFVQVPGKINADYRTPFDTGGINSIFKPLVRLSRDHLLIPTASTVGPAFFESVFESVKSVCGDELLAGLRGEGTERLTKDVFAQNGLKCSFEGVKYSLKKIGEGECDFVFEDDTDILFVECKAKPLTRGAMTGTQGDALLDFAGGIFEAQAQALQHERILRERGSIQFVDGRQLKYRGQRVTRLSVTLQDHGALQDRWIMQAVYNALLSAQVSCSPDYPRKDQLNKFNRFLKKFQRETGALAQAGVDVNSQSLSLASSSISQLDVLLQDVKNLSEVRTRLAIPVNYGSYNALFDYHHLQKMGASRLND